MSLLALVALGVAQSKHELMSYEEYAKLAHPRPYVLEITQGAGCILYFGITHTNRPNDPQLAFATQLWDELKPERALSEGGVPPLEKTFEASVSTHGDPGYMRWMASRDQVEIESIDPSREVEVAALSRQFTPSRIKTFFALRWYTQYRTRPAERQMKPEAAMTMYLARASRTKGLEGAPLSLAELETEARSIRADAADWAKAPAEWFYPGRTESEFNTIATASSQFRDGWIIDRLAEELQTGKRVFVMIGCSHVVMQEKALRAAMPGAKIRRIKNPTER